MSTTAIPPVEREPRHRLLPWLRALSVLALLFFFLVGVKGLGSGFKLLGSDLLESFFSATSNPFIALMVGILATTLVQSSSVTTSMIVGLVAAPVHPLPVANAIPMVMGANIGTTVTNTVVSLAYMGHRNEFRRAYATATCHDFFNFLAVLVLLPLELATGYLRHTATALTSLLGEASGVDYESPFKSVLSLAVAPIKGLAHLVSDSERGQGVVVVLLSAVVIYAALLMLVRVMRRAVQNRVEVFITRVLGRSPVLSLSIGAIVTVMVQSSSVTTSLLVPLAGAGVITLRQAFPITLGANIGTTVTALLASLAASGPNARAGVTIALVHLLFNVSGVILVYPWPAVRRIPLRLARRFADVAYVSKRWVLIYVIMLFYGLPALFALLNRWLR